MWSVGGSVKFIPATTDSDKGLKKGLERAAASISKLQQPEWGAFANVRCPMIFFNWG